MTLEAAVTSSLIQWLDWPTDPSVLGGKARPLTTLIAAGLPVPPGFVILPGAFPATGTDITSPDEAVAVLSPATREQIARAYAELGRRLGESAPHVAIRSSAAAEDMAGASFAGQYETFLGVSGTDAVADYAARCWASLFTPHAAAYREQVERRTGRALPPPAMSVLVQSLVAAEAAGVAFTADPVTGATDAVAINASWGLGQSVVDGEVEADTWRVDRATLAVVEQRVGDKPTRSGLRPDAAREAVPDRLRREPCLTAAEVSQVAALALRAEAAIGTPADVEWATAGGTLWLLQARPITTGVAGGVAAPSTTAQAPAVASVSTGPTAAFPFVWPDAETERLHWALFARGDSVEPVLPLRQDGALASSRARWNAAFLDGSEEVRALRLFNGYAYVGQVLLPGTAQERAYRRDAFLRPAAALIDQGIVYRSAVHYPEIDPINARLAAVDVAGIPPAALAEHFEECFRWFERSWTLHWLSPRGAHSAQQRFADLYTELTGDTREGASGELLAYEPNLLIEAIDRLLDMARIAQRHTALRDLLLSAEPAEALAALDGVDGGTEFRAALEDLLERQGLRSGAGFGTASDPIMPGWREQPTIVVELVQKYVPQDLDALLSARAAAVEARDRRVEEIRNSIAGEEKRREFDFWLDAARRAQQGFEDHNYKINSAAGSLLHYAITACGRSLSRAGLLETAEDAWWLRAHELSLALRGLDTGGNSSNSGNGVGRRCAEPGERATSGCVARGGARLVPLAHAARHPRRSGATRRAGTQRAAGAARRSGAEGRTPRCAGDRSDRVGRRCHRPRAHRGQPRCRAGRRAGGRAGGAQRRAVVDARLPHRGGGRAE